VNTIGPLIKDRSIRPATAIDSAGGRGYASSRGDSDRRNAVSEAGAIVLILLGLAAAAASYLPSGQWSSVSIAVLRRGGTILSFSAPTWVVAHAVYAPGRITFHRLQGAIVIYLSLATIFAVAYSLIWELDPGAVANLVARMGDPEEVGTMLYLSLTTLTTTGYGHIMPVDPFARSLANLESVIGPF